MTYKAVLLAEAETEMLDARQWYLKTSPEQCQRLVFFIEEAVTRVCENPALFPAVFLDIRKTNLKVFPYKLFFRVDEANKLIVLYAFVHHKRSNKFVAKRVKARLP